MSSISIMLQIFVYKELMSMLSLMQYVWTWNIVSISHESGSVFSLSRHYWRFDKYGFDSHSQRPSWTPTKSIIQVLQSDMMCIFLADFQDVIDSCTESNFYVCLDLQTICSFELMQFTVFVYHKRCKFTSINLKNLYITTCQSIAI